ncbi:tol-pal system YbgF family protein [Nonomuraea sp. NPDC049309]|uniref:tetratricopeptide repeat protein n=1 Tax=Nonomuraea sp. NPDC049309 TaxID=3364350 RepID=UPI003723A1D2
MNALPTKDACETRTITDWLAKRPSGDPVLDRAAEIVPKVAPAAIVGCGDALAKDKEWKKAKAQYEQFLDQYPKNDLAGRAKEGKEKAVLQIELANVRKLLKGGEPKYCKDPAPYHGAKPYRGKGPHRAILIGQGGHRTKLPSSWLTKDPAKAVLVICAGKSKHGTPVRTCPYRSLTGSYPYTVNVTFKKRKIPVRVYELRTGKRVGPHSVQIGGSACPRRIHYTYYITDYGPPSEMYVKSSKSDIRAAYGTLIRP